MGNKQHLGFPINLIGPHKHTKLHIFMPFHVVNVAIVEEESWRIFPEKDASAKLRVPPVKIQTFTTQEEDNIQSINIAANIRFLWNYFDIVFLYAIEKFDKTISHGFLNASHRQACLYRSII